MKLKRQPDRRTLHLIKTCQRRVEFFRFGFGNSHESDLSINLAAETVSRTFFRLVMKRINQPTAGQTRGRSKNFEEILHFTSI